MFKTGQTATKIEEFLASNNLKQNMATYYIMNYFDNNVFTVDYCLIFMFMWVIVLYYFI